MLKESQPVPTEELILIKVVLKLINVRIKGWGIFTQIDLVGTVLQLRSKGGTKLCSRSDFCLCFNSLIKTISVHKDH